MLYLRLEDHKITIADYTRPASVDAGAEGVLTLVEHVMTPTLSLRQNLQEARRQHPLFQQVKDVEVIVNGPVTLVPVSEYDDSVEDVLFKSCFRVASEVPYRVLADVIPQLRTMLLFGVRKSVSDGIGVEFQGGNIHYTSATSLLLRQFAQHNADAQRCRVYVNCRDRYIDVAAFIERQLVACCPYEVSCASDAVYYVLALSKALGFVPSETLYITVGNNATVQEITAMLRRFAPSVRRHTLGDDFGTRPITQHPAVPFDLGLMLLA